MHRPGFEPRQWWRLRPHGRQSRPLLVQYQRIAGRWPEDKNLFRTSQCIKSFQPTDDTPFLWDSGLLCVGFHALVSLDVRAPNSLIVAVLTAIPTMKTALTHYQYRYLEEQSDSEWSRDHTNNPTVRLLHTSKHSFIIVCQWNVESLASLVFGRPICWSWACYFSDFFLTKFWDTSMLFGDRMRSDSVTSSSGTFLKMSNVFYHA